MPPCSSRNREPSTFEHLVVYLRLQFVARHTATSWVYELLCASDDDAHRGTLRTTMPKKGTTEAQARRCSMDIMYPALLRMENPCPIELAWVHFGKDLLRGKPLLLFPRHPPMHWFKRAQVVGVDFEGSPPRLVQIACERGVVVARCWATWVASVLQDRRLVHAVFGGHESHLVACPVDTQALVMDRHPTVRGHQWSLADATSLVLPRYDGVRLLKDKSIHRRINWHRCARQRQLTEEAAVYAATDAEATRRLALHFLNT